MYVLPHLWSSSRTYVAHVANLYSQFKNEIVS